jgi:hypothetical protein
MNISSPDCSLLDSINKIQTCFTVIPQLKNYYRFGELRQCQWEIQEFRFCWKIKSLEKQERIEKVKEKREELYRDKVYKRASSSVWEILE